MSVEREQALTADLERTLQALASGVERQPSHAIAVGGSFPLLAASAAVGASMGFRVVAPDDRTGALNPLERIAVASGMRVREVTLPQGWEHASRVPLLIFAADGKAWRPLALLPRRNGRARIYDPESDAVSPLGATMASSVNSRAYQFYRPLPEKPDQWRELVRFGLHDIRSDLLTVAVLALGSGLVGLLIPVLTKLAFSTIIPAGSDIDLVYLGIALALGALVTFAISSVFGLAITRLGGQLALSFQSGLWDRLIDLPPRFFRRYSAGELASRALGVDQIRQILATSVAGSAFALLASTANLVLMVLYSPGLALVALTVLCLAGAGLALAARRQAFYARKTIEARNKLEGDLVQAVNGVSKLRVAGAEDRMFSRLANRALDVQRGAYHQQHVGVGAAAASAALSAVVAIALFAAITQLSFAAMDAPTFIAFNAAFGVVVGAMLGFTSQIAAAAPIAPLARAVRPILEAEPEVTRSGADPGELRGAIAIRDLSFSYEHDGPEVLRGINLDIAPGEFVAIVGASGSGKSTLMRLLLGFEEPTTGAIFYDAQDLSQLDLRAVRRQLGVVLQCSGVIPGSIRENILGSTDLKLEDAWEAARRAGIDEEIRAMPMGIETLVGPDSISGGQQQRIVIARSLVASPRIVLLDEATSALDNAVQQVVADSLAALKATRVVIAHRLSTVREADRIIVMDAGSIAESGRYENLIEAGGNFARLARRQIA